MPEYVVTVEPSGAVRGRAGLGRAGAVLDRVGERSRDPRSIRAAFDMLAASRGRYPIARVRRHVCLHDQGVMDCSSAVVEG